MNLLEIIQQTCLELGIGSPDLVVGSQDPQTNQLLALLQRHGHDLCRQFEWQRLDKQYLFTTVQYSLTGDITLGSPVITNIPSTAALTTNFGVFGSGILPFSDIVSIDSPTQVTMNQPAQATAVGEALSFSQVAYPLPPDWLKQIPQTEWDRTNRWPLLGPKSPQEWQSYESGIVYAGPRERFRIQDQAIQVNPPPPAPLTFSYEYISSYYVIGADGTAKPRFTADTDTTLFDDSLMIAGLKVRWLNAKGLPLTFEGSEYANLLSGLMAQDKSAPKLSLSPSYGDILLGYRNVQDGDWGGPF